MEGCTIEIGQLAWSHPDWPVQHSYSVLLGSHSSATPEAILDPHEGESTCDRFPVCQLALLKLQQLSTSVSTSVSKGESGCVYNCMHYDLNTVNYFLRLGGNC
jgi:hypothetical protein